MENNIKHVEENNLMRPIAMMNVEIGFGKCRCCLSEGNHRSIMSKDQWDDGEHDLYNIFIRIFDLRLETHSELTTLICYQCIKRLRDAYEFRSMVVQVEKQLLDDVSLVSEAFKQEVSSKIEQDAQADKLSQMELTEELNIKMENDEPNETLVKNEMMKHMSGSGEVINEAIKQEISSKVEQDTQVEKPSQIKLTEELNIKMENYEPNETFVKNEMMEQMSGSSEVIDEVTIIECSFPIEKTNKALLQSHSVEKESSRISTPVSVEKGEGQPKLDATGYGSSAGSEPASTPLPDGSGDAGFSTRLSKSKRRRLKRQKQAEKEAEIAAALGKPVHQGKYLPRGKTKRQTQEDESPQQQPAKRPHLAPSKGPRISAREQSDHALMVYRSDGVPMDDEFAKGVRKKLRELLSAAALESTGGRNLAFAASGLGPEGFFLVTPELPDAKDWLLSQDLDEVNGVQLKIRKLDRAKVSIWLPGDKEDHLSDKMVILMFRSQNEHRADIRIKDWVLISRDILQHGERLVMGVPQDVFGDRDQVWLHYEFTKVQARLIGRHKTQTDTGINVEQAKATNGIAICPHCGMRLTNLTSELAGASPHIANQESTRYLSGSGGRNRPRFTDYGRRGRFNTQTSTKACTSRRFYY